MSDLPAYSVLEYEMNEPAWWLRHHKQNLLYLCMRIQKLIDNPNDEDYKNFFYSHFKSVLPDFIESAQSNPISEEKTS